MLIGYMRASTDSDRQVLDLQRDALLSAGVDERHLFEDWVSGSRGDRAGLADALAFLRPADCLAKRTAACHQSSTIVAPGSASRCSRHSPASPSHSTVAGVSAPTPAATSACLNASDAVAGPLRAKAKRCWAPRASMTLPATTSKWRSGRCRLRT